MMRKLALAALFLFACGVLPAMADNCSTYATSIVFGNYTGTTIDVTGTLTVNCNVGASYTVGLNAGMNSSSVNNRKMYGGNGGAQTLAYSLFSDPAYTINWGNTGGTGLGTGRGNGRGQQITIYARIPANQFGALGSYTDTITASVSGSAFKTATAVFSVTATGLPGCTITANPLNFGTYSGLLINSSSTITATCSSATSYNVGLNAGTATGATVTNRSMTGPASSLLSYRLFSNSTRTTNWGNTVGTNTVAGTGAGTAQTLTVYGQIPAGQAARPGSYTDTITATINY